MTPDEVLSSDLERTIAENLREVRDRIAKAAARAGRSPETIRLVAVSKTKPSAFVRAAYAAGQRDFGENYAKELETKATELAGTGGFEALRWHFIGHLQSNKAKVVARFADVVHAVHSKELADELDKRRAALGLAPLSCLVEVNVSGEAGKHGCPPELAQEVTLAVAKSAHLRAAGLMTMPPFGDLERARAVFSELRTLRDQLRARESAFDLGELSMGMSDDLEIAIAEGATIVRVGTAIFGERG